MIRLEDYPFMEDNDKTRKGKNVELLPAPAERLKPQSFMAAITTPRKERTFYHLLPSSLDDLETPLRCLVAIHLFLLAIRISSMVFISPQIRERIRELRGARTPKARTASKLSPIAGENRAADESKREATPRASDFNGQPAQTAKNSELESAPTIHAQVELQHPKPFRDMALREAISHFEEVSPRPL